jgi:hypothetical protein
MAPKGLFNTINLFNSTNLPSRRGFGLQNRLGGEVTANWRG